MMSLSLVQVEDLKEVCCLVRINWNNWIASLWVCFELNFEGNLQSKILLRFGLVTSSPLLTYDTPSLKVSACIKPDYTVRGDLQASKPNNEQLLDSAVCVLM